MKCFRNRKITFDLLIDFPVQQWKLKKIKPMHPSGTDYAKRVVPSGGKDDLRLENRSFPGAHPVRASLTMQKCSRSEQYLSTIA